MTNADMHVLQYLAPSVKSCGGSVITWSTILLVIKSNDCSAYLNISQGTGRNFTGLKVHCVGFRGLCLQNMDEMAFNMHNYLHLHIPGLPI